MKLTLLERFAGLVGAYALHHYSSSWDGRCLFRDYSHDPKGRICGGPFIYAFWHEYILLPVAYYGHCRLATITSRHRDAEIVTHLARHTGFQIFRGSTTRGGTAALRRLLGAGSDGMHLTMMPDGPKGPRRRMSLGTIYAASKMGFPILPVGLGAYPCWRADSWDRFAVPKPFSRIRFVLDEEIFVPDGLKREELEEYRLLVEEKLTELTFKAESWAESGGVLPGDVPLNHRAVSLKKYRSSFPENVLDEVFSEHCQKASNNFPGLEN